MTTIYLIRHAEAEGNLCRRIHGQYDTNVTPKGMVQIAELRKRFETISVDACYASDLTRTKTTAQAICLPKGLELHADPAFREVNLGVWEGLPFGYLNTFEQESMHRFNQDPQNWHVEQGENFEQYTGRFLAGLERIARNHPEQTVAVVSHAAVMRGVFLRLFPDLVPTHSDNTAVTKLAWEQGTFQMIYCNDSSHLEAGKSTLRRQKWQQQDGAQGDDTLWFQPGLQPAEALAAVEGAWTFTALEGQRPVGHLTLSEDSTDTGRIDDLSLVPSYRGFGLGIQLLGQAIFTMRPLGKRWLRIRIPKENPALEKLCAQLAFVPEESGDWVLDLPVRVRPI